jgi:flagellar FliJ protein
VKKFRFNLETVLRVRRQVEEARQRELAVAKGERDKALMRLSSREHGLRGLLAELGEQRAKAVDLAKEAWFAARWNGFNREILDARGDLALKEAAFEAARLRTVEASRDRLALENLEAKQLREHLFKLNREEQGLLDDLAQRAQSAFSLPPTSAAGR